MHRCDLRVDKLLFITTALYDPQFCMVYLKVTSLLLAYLCCPWEKDKGIQKNHAFVTALPKASTDSHLMAVMLAGLAR